MQQQGSKYFAHRPPTTTPPLDPGYGSIGQNSVFSEHVHVTYQIKENQECSNMVANISTTDPYHHPTPWTLGIGSIGQNSTFSEHGHVAWGQ